MLESRGVHVLLRDELLHSVQVVDYLRERIHQTSLSAVRTLRKQPTIVTNICSHTFPWLVYNSNRLPLQAAYDTNTKRHFHHRRPFSYPGALKMTYAKKIKITWAYGLRTWPRNDWLLCVATPQENILGACLNVHALIVWKQPPWTTGTHQSLYHSLLWPLQLHQLLDTLTPTSRATQAIAGGLVCSCWRSFQFSMILWSYTRV